MVGEAAPAIAQVIARREPRLVSIQMIGRRWRRLAFPAERRKETPIVRIGAIGRKKRLASAA
jgi:hypothetical protein